VLYPDAVRQHMQNIRPLATAWHRSKAGRESGKRAARMMWARVVREKRNCIICGQQYTGVRNFARKGYCSKGCRHKARLASGVDNEKRTCPVCGKSYSTNKYSTSRTCSRRCGQALRASST
jgi:endogenous inhibitor of DNA gyrase (YacG/DUF329 family)